MGEPYRCRDQGKDLEMKELAEIEVQSCSSGLRVQEEEGQSWPALSPTATPMDFGDWLTLIGPAI